MAVEEEYWWSGKCGQGRIPEPPLVLTGRDPKLPTCTLKQCRKEFTRLVFQIILWQEDPEAPVSWEESKSDLKAEWSLASRTDALALWEAFSGCSV